MTVTFWRYLRKCLLAKSRTFQEGFSSGEGRSILAQTGYNLSSRNLIWDIGRVGLVVSHDSVNDGNHLPAGMAHGRHVGLLLCIAFFFAYCGANSALPRASSLVTAVRFLNG